MTVGSLHSTIGSVQLNAVMSAFPHDSWDNFVSDENTDINGLAELIGILI
jgi:hypothetical protein